MTEFAQYSKALLSLFDNKIVPTASIQIESVRDVMNALGYTMQTSITGKPSFKNKFGHIISLSNAVSLHNGTLHASVVCSKHKIGVGDYVYAYDQRMLDVVALQWDSKTKQIVSTKKLIKYLEY